MAQETLGLEAVPRGSVRWINGELFVKGTGRTAEELAKCAPVKKEEVDQEKKGDEKPAVAESNGAVAAAPVDGSVLPTLPNDVASDDDEAEQKS